MKHLAHFWVGTTLISGSFFGRRQHCSGLRSSLFGPQPVHPGNVTLALNNGGGRAACIDGSDPAKPHAEALEALRRPARRTVEGVMVVSWRIARLMRISVIVDGYFSLIVDGETAPSEMRWGSAQVLG